MAPARLLPPQRIPDDSPVSEPNPERPVVHFYTITGADWKRSLKNARQRRKEAPERTREQIPSKHKKPKDK